MEHDPVAGELLGPPAEQLVYHNPEHRQMEMTLFWAMVEQIIIMCPGSYDNVPMAFREEATDALSTNA